MSSVRGSAGSPWTFSARYDPFSFETHSADSNPGTLTNGVLIGCSEGAHGLGAAEEVFAFLPAARYACNAPTPPPSAAGFVQAAAIPSPGARPKREFAGGGAFSRNVT